MGQKKYPDELRERATRTGVGGAGWPGAGQGRDPQDRRELGVHPEALRTWVKKAQIDQGTRPGTTTDQAQQGAGERGPRAEKSQRDPKEHVSLSNAAECERPSR